MMGYFIVDKSFIFWLTDWDRSNVDNDFIVSLGVSILSFVTCNFVDDDEGDTSSDSVSIKVI